MNILHLTDSHFQAKGKDPSKIVKAIIAELKKERVLIHFIFFTGDLVNIGGDHAPYTAAKENLFDPFITELGVEANNVIICPGNHDIDRTKRSVALKSYIENELISNDKLNNFYKNNNSVDFRNSINPLAPFSTFVSAFYEKGDCNIISDLYTIHFRQYADKKIGVVCLSTPWVSSIFDDDQGKLLIPTALLDDVCKKTRHCDQKIILMHHPLYFLMEFNFCAVENTVHSEFNLCFSGHVHKISSLSRHNGTNGIFEHVATAALSSDERQGCSVVQIDDVEENRISVRELVFADEINRCAISQEVNHTIPCGIDKIEILSFRKKLHDKVILEKENANTLLLLDSDENARDFMSLYTHPVLKKESESNLESKNTPSLGFDELITMENNYFILGKDKCGKTSLLKRLQIEHLINFSRNGRIPFYMDAKEYEAKIDDKFAIEDVVRSYYGIKKAKVNEIFLSSSFVLLIDNFSPSSGFASYFEAFLKDYPAVKFIVCAEENLARTVDVLPLANASYEKVFFHKLRKQELVLYTEKRLDPCVKVDDIREKITALCVQLELPMNYWTISLLLLIHNKSSESYAKNLFSILDVCIDEIFNKKRILISRWKISPDQLKRICAELSQKMFEEHASEVYSLSEHELLSYIDRIISENDRISISSNDIFRHFLACGVLKQKEDDYRFVFRLNGFFEYFLAYQMTKDTSFRDSIINNDKTFVAFKNQIEIYSGFKRDDYSFLDAVFTKVKIKIDPVFNSYNPDKDVELLTKIKAKAKLEQFCKKLSITKTLSSIEKAQIEDQFPEPQINSEVHIIKPINLDKINSELLERYISILARTFRSSDEILGKREEKKRVFDYIVDSYCNFGFFMVEEFEKFAKKEFESDDNFNLEDFPELELLNFISNFTPLICQVSLFDGVGHFSLERIIKSEIDTMVTSEIIPEYKLFMLCFLLLDIDLERNLDYVLSVIDYIKIPVLKYAIVMKLNYYLAFKGGDDRLFQKKLSNCIQQARLRLDGATSFGDIHKQIHAKKKVLLINKHRE